jgi:hypothetical protein
MDPLTLAASVVPLLALYLGHMGERAAQRLGEAIGTAAAAKLGRIYELVKAKVAGRPEAQTALELVERRPDDPGGRERFASQLEGLAAVDREFADELRRLVADAHREGGVALTQFVDAGAVAIHGNVIQHGTYNAGRDINLG